MGTKNKPGEYDCYHNAEPDEPMFVLLGRDPMAGWLVRTWAWMRKFLGEDPKIVQEARDCADAMDRWAQQCGKSPHTVQAWMLDTLGIKQNTWRCGLCQGNDHRNHSRNRPYMCMTAALSDPPQPCTCSAQPNNIPRSEKPE
jgi:hypothetical protein